MNYKPYIQNFNRRSGFSLLEVLVATGLFAVIGTMVGGAVLAQKKILKSENSRTAQNQDLRAMFDLIGTEIRLAGEKLSPNFPAILLANGSDGAADTITLRRNLLDKPLKLCNGQVGPITNSGRRGVLNIRFSKPKNASRFACTTDPADDSCANPPECTFGKNSENFIDWTTALNESADNIIKAYMYRVRDDASQFFSVRDVRHNNAGSNSEYYSLRAVDGTQWIERYKSNTPSNDPPGDSAWIYLLEEWRLSLNNSDSSLPNYRILQLVEFNDRANPLNLASNVSDFQIAIKMKDDSVKNQFNNEDLWTEIKSIQVEIEVVDPQTDRRQKWRSGYFPRNIISTGS